jgi:predicted site-specific integrase-resolvase
MNTKRLTAAQLAELPYLTLEQTAQLLQCSTEHIRRQVRTGTLPGAVNVCGVYRVRTDELLKLNGQVAS